MIEWAEGQPSFLSEVWETLGAFQPHPDVSITLTKSGPLPPVQLNPHDHALGNPAEPLQQKRQQKKKAPPPIEQQKELVDPRTGFEPTSGRPGSTPNLFGGGFYPNKDITITESSPAGPRPVGVITPDASGSFDIMFRIPDSTPAGHITYTFRQEPDVKGLGHIFSGEAARSRATIRRSRATTRRSRATTRSVPNRLTTLASPGKSQGQQAQTEGWSAASRPRQQDRSAGPLPRATARLVAVGGA